MADMIKSKDNSLVKQIHKLMISSKERKNTQSFVCEGLRLCRDAVLSGAKIPYFLYTAKAVEKYSDEIAFISSKAERRFVISDSVFEKITDTKSPQGFLCVVNNNKDQLIGSLQKGKKYVGLERIQDPSNMGTILRTAEALGADGVIMSSDCCDVFSPKVVRGSMGAVFRLPFIITDDITALIYEYNIKGIKSYASTPKDAKNINDIDFDDGGIMLIGNEGNGLSEELMNVSTERVKITMKGRAESLNASAAAAILLYKFIC